MRKSWVKAVEHGWVEVKSTKFLNCSEDEMGRDVYTFKYKGKEYESIVVVGSQPG
jgi:hypothetical protein